MCGIIGCITRTDFLQKIMNGLSNLEYRGYDSAGISYITNGEIITQKRVGKVEFLRNSLPTSVDSICGIAHTRWATHGEVTEANSHPHNYGDWSIAHNGIIENYEEIKQKELSTDEFLSETDSEIIAHLLEHDTKKGETEIKALINTCSKLVGSYAILAINKNLPSTIFIAKKRSPVYIAVTHSETIVASDLISFRNYTNKFFEMNDDEYAILSDNKIAFFDTKGNEIQKTKRNISATSIKSELGSFDYYMEKEINDIPTALIETFRYYKSHPLPLPQVLLEKVECIQFVACGTAYHSGLMAEKFVNKICKIDSRTHIASEFNCFEEYHTKPNEIYIFISQSGETADTLLAQAKIKFFGGITVALTNSPNSTLASKCDFVMPIIAGPEIAVASTKAYNAQLLALLMLAEIIKVTKENVGTERKQLTKLIRNNFTIYHPSKKTYLTQLFDLVVRPDEKYLAHSLKNTKNIYLIGKDMDYITSLEAGLKLKEITYVPCTSIPAGELKHGTLALIDSNSLVIATLTEKEMESKIQNALSEVKSRCASTILVTPFRTNSTETIDRILTIPILDNETSPFVYQIMSVIVYQKIAYYLSLELGNDPDKPRNLAKSVTVE